MYWFTSDTHFGHANIIDYCSRPFKNLEDMNNKLIRNWNLRVKKDDTVFHLGDFCFKNTIGGKPGEGEPLKADYYESKLNGKIILVSGNHDSHNSAKSVIQEIIIYHGGVNIKLRHEPDLFEYGMLNLCGHVHDKWKIQWKDPVTPIVNVGTDVWRYHPIKIDEILSCVAKNPYRKTL